MEIKTHLENHGINTSCCVCGLGYELIPHESVPYTHEAYVNGQHLGVICCDCYVAGEAWLRTMLERPLDEPIIDILRPRYLDILSGQFAGPADRCKTCGGLIPDEDAAVVLHLAVTRQGYREVQLSHRTCRPDVALEKGPGTARLCLLQLP